MTRRRTQHGGPAESTADPFAVAVSNWLESPEAVRYAARLLGRARLGGNGLAEEVVDTVRTNIWMRLADGPLDDPTTPVVPYCKRAVHNHVEDLRRGFRYDPLDGRPARRRGDRDGEKQGRKQAVNQPGPDPYRSITESEDVHTGAIATLRSRLETSGEPAAVVSGALTYLTLEMYDDCDLDGVPWPKAGATPAQARLWPALWFAGRRDGIFPTGRASAAQRQRLRRAGLPIEQLLITMKEWLRRDLAAANEGDLS